MEKRGTLKKFAVWSGAVGLLVIAVAWWMAGTETPSEVLAQGRQLAQNPGFETGGSPAPSGWTFDQKRAGNKGTVSLDRSRKRSGAASLKLQPNGRNVAEDPLAITQIIPAAQYRGQRVQFSGWMITEGNTQGIIGVLSLVRGGATAGPEMLFQNPTGGDWVHHEKTYNVPDDPTVQLVLICMSNGKGGASWFDDLAITPVGGGGNRGAVDQRPDPRPNTPGALNASITVDASSVVRTIPRTLYGTNIEWRWNGLFLWQEKERRTHPVLTALTKDLGVSLIRYPGGFFSDFYHWRDGIGPLDSRKEVRHEPGKDDKSKPLFGTEEVLKFGQDVGAEVLLTANAGTGTAQEAADWVKYVNGKGQRVRFWEVGNELYFKSDAPETATIAVDPVTYANRYGEFARAMRAADPKIKIGAIGGENYGRYQFVSYPNWLRTVLERQGNQIDFVAIHNSYAPLISDENVEFRSVYRAMLAAPVSIARNLQTVSDMIEKYAPARASQIKIAVTEWGPAFRFDINSRWVDHPKTLGSALFTASALKTFIEAPRVEIANNLMLHDVSVYGAIGSQNTDFPPNSDWIPTARYYAFQLFTKHFGDRLIRSTSESPTYDSPSVGFSDAVKGVPYLDVVSSLSADGQRLYVIAVNKHFDSPIEAKISLRGFTPAGQGEVWTLNGAGLDANTGTGIIKVPGMKVPVQAENPENPRLSKGGRNEITFRSSPISATGPELTYRFPAHSATSIMLTRSK